MNLVWGLLQCEKMKRNWKWKISYKKQLYLLVSLSLFFSEREKDTGQKHKKWCNLKENIIFTIYPKSHWPDLPHGLAKCRLKAQIWKFCQLWRRQNDVVLCKIFSQSVKNLVLEYEWMSRKCANSWQFTRKGSWI